MSIIERAIERIELLRRAGVEGGEVPASPHPSAAEGHPEGTGFQTATEAGQSIAAKMPPDVPASSRSAIADAQVSPAADSRSSFIELDLARLQSLGLVVPSEPRSRIAEEFRVIKRPVLANAHGKGAAPVDNGNLIMVTSSVPGEGKSFNSINLAMSIAMELDNRVLLVDADVARPSILNLLGIPPAKGLMDVLLDQNVGLSDVLLRTNIDKLSILPAGMPHKNATELLASAAMKSMLVELAHRYSDRIIVFDSPPLMVTTEAPVLAHSMGQIILVVEAGRTAKSMVEQALTKIRNCPVKMLVLNKARYARNDGYYGYYGYGYGYGAGGTAADDAMGKTA